MRHFLFLTAVSALTFVAFSSLGQAHEETDPTQPHVHMIPAAVEKNMVSITTEGDYRFIAANGIPNHQTGQFPNRGNPNAISAQDHHYRVPLYPQMTGRATPQNGVIGVALNGIPFEPGTAECYGRPRGVRGPMESCAWREEAIVKGEGQLGLDSSNAHVQPNGTYHYHGVPYGLLAILGGGDIVTVGYAADGFPLVVSRSGTYKSGYRLKKGQRDGGPGGAYDGTYTADYEYAGSGTQGHKLDECNGTTIDGAYVYFITDEFPFAPRCLMGQADNSFARRRPPAFDPNHRREQRRPLRPF